MVLGGGGREREGGVVEAVAQEVEEVFDALTDRWQAKEGNDDAEDWERTRPAEGMHS